MSDRGPHRQRAALGRVPVRPDTSEDSRQRVACHPLADSDHFDVYKSIAHGRHVFRDRLQSQIVTSTWERRMSIEEERPLRKMITERQLLEILCTSRSSLRRWCLEGKFPKPVALGPSRIAWFVDEVAEWQNSRPSSRRSSDH
ncbi:helix-turn-helix transcriptional regulator [Bradyrhizobium tunisiense]|uniref:helix-turn-helix transcriptional regulator n=1 Tax=Bradyrhizobium tunisiense TaxID=3278709 RepID=UPI0035D754E1